MNRQPVRQSEGSPCLTTRVLALLAGIGLCCGGGDVFAQFRAESDLAGGDNIQGAVASTASSTAVGTGARALALNSTALGNLSEAAGTGSTALGRGSMASLNNSTAIGDIAYATGEFSTAVGQASLADGFGSTTVGHGSRAGGIASTALGADADATGSNSTALGVSSKASGDGSTAVGAGTEASGTYSTALGVGSKASADASIALGKDTFASATSSSAVGVYSHATGISSSAFGSASEASGTGSTAVGMASVASGYQSIALGQQSVAGFDGSAAIGAGATTTRADQMMFGTATNTYTAPGITSGASRAAQSGTREIVTTDSSGNLASDTAAGLGLATTTGMSALQQDVNRNTEGVAMAMALSGIPTVLPHNTNYAISANWGTFGAENAMALGGSARLTDNIFLNGGGTLGTGGRNGNAGGRAGVTFAW